VRHKGAPLCDQTPPIQKPLLEFSREAIEEDSGERFAITEKLHASGEFVPSLQTAHTRAIRNVRPTVLNSNVLENVYALTPQKRSSRCHCFSKEGVAIFEAIPWR